MTNDTNISLPVQSNPSVTEKLTSQTVTAATSIVTLEYSGNGSTSSRVIATTSRPVRAVIMSEDATSTPLAPPTDNGLFESNADGTIEYWLTFTTGSINNPVSVGVGGTTAAVLVGGGVDVGLIALVLGQFNTNGKTYKLVAWLS